MHDQGQKQGIVHVVGSMFEDIQSRLCTSPATGTLPVQQEGREKRGTEDERWGGPVVPSSHLNSGEATTIFASWGSRGYSAMMLPTCAAIGSEHDTVLSDVNAVSLSSVHRAPLTEACVSGRTA